MELREYQRRSQETDQLPGKSPEARVVPLLGMAGEVGSLLSEYKKRLRDGDAHRMFKSEIEEELGDILWYLSNTAEKFDVDLESCAQKNLVKTAGRWPYDQGTMVSYFDLDFPENERLPRYMSVKINEQIEKVNGQTKSRVLTYVDGTLVGDPLTDNAYEDDGYRFHDVFHYAYAAVLGWSPIVRGILRRKRKSNPLVDEVEDGGRAAVIEEAIAAMVFEYAGRHNDFDGIEWVDFKLLHSIKRLTERLEVRVRTVRDWELAILEGFRVWRIIRSSNGGEFEVDLVNRRLHVG